MRVWRLADGTPVGEPLTSPKLVCGGGRGAAGRHPGHHQRRSQRDGAGLADRRRHPGRRAAAQPRRLGGPVAAGALPDGTPVIISGGDDGTVRVWRIADGTPVGEPLTGHDDAVHAVAAGALPDGTPVIISGGATARCGCGGSPTAPRSASRCAATTAGWTRWRPGCCRTAPRSSSAAATMARCGCGGPPTAPRSASRCPATTARWTRWRPGRCRMAPRSSSAAATGGTVRVWRLADGTPVGEPLTGHDDSVRGGGGRGAAGRHPGHHQRRRGRHGAGVADRRRHPGRRAADRPRPAG